MYPSRLINRFIKLRVFSALFRVTISILPLDLFSSIASANLLFDVGSFIRMASEDDWATIASRRDEYKSSMDVNFTCSIPWPPLASRLTGMFFAIIIFLLIDFDPVFDFVFNLPFFFDCLIVAFVFATTFVKVDGNWDVIVFS